MTYILKKDPKKGGYVHIFDEELALCDGKEHDAFGIVSRKIVHSLVSCKECMKELTIIVREELKEILGCWWFI